MNRICVKALLDQWIRDFSICPYEVASAASVSDRTLRRWRNPRCPQEPTAEALRLLKAKYPDFRALLIEAEDGDVVRLDRPITEDELDQNHDKRVDPLDFVIATSKATSLDQQAQQVIAAEPQLTEPRKVYLLSVVRQAERMHRVATQIVAHLPSRHRRQAIRISGHQ